MGVDREELQKSVDAYNEECEGGDNPHEVQLSVLCSEHIYGRISTHFFRQECRKLEKESLQKKFKEIIDVLDEMLDDNHPIYRDIRKG